MDTRPFVIAAAFGLAAGLIVAGATPLIELRTYLADGRPAREIAETIAEFLAAARRSLDLAHYDFHLSEETAAIVGGAIREAHGRGVAVRIAYNVDHRNPIPVPPPPEPDGSPHRVASACRTRRSPASPT